MKLNKIFLLFFAFSISYSNAQVICEFGIRFVGGGGAVYSCGISANNPNGSEITEIHGFHLEGYTDADVLGVVRVNGSLGTAFPPVFCQRFPNIQAFGLYNTGITEITDASFSGCNSLNYLSILTNRISSISQNAFVNNQNLTYIDLDSNQLTTLPENVFASLGNLATLDIRNNPFESIPAGAFNGLGALSTLFLQNSRLTAINPAWFAATPNLISLYLYNNNISEFNAAAFTGLSNLQTLDMGGNNISGINENSFVGLENLSYLSLNDNFFPTLRNGTFRALTNLVTLQLSGCNVSEIENDAFDGLTNLTSLYLNFNDIEDLEVGVFRTLSRLIYLGLWNSRLKTLRRNPFGPNITTIATIDLDGNVVNSLERSLFDDLTGLNLLYFTNNLCASGVFSGFIANRLEFMQRLERCFRNFELIIDTVTDNNVDYLFFRGENPGIVARVQAEDEIQIALTPFNFPWSPMIEVIIGAANNTRSIIRRNQDEDVAVVPSPGIIRSNQQNLFRIVWANHVILVFRDNEQWPFLVHTMIDFFNVNFYGLRTLQSRATWSIQPV